MAEMRRSNAKRWLFPLLAMLLGTLLALIFLELLLLAGHHLLFGKQTPQANSNIEIVSPNPSRDIIFAGDSWTYGSDALPNAGFFHQLTREPEFEPYSLLNFGYPSYNYFQVINKVIGHEQIPRFVITTGGANSWHLLGLKQFTKHAKKYLSIEEFLQFNNDFQEKSQWYTRFRTYKLFLFLLSSSETPTVTQAKTGFDQQKMDVQLGSKTFWRALADFRIQYPDYQSSKEHIGSFLQNYPSLTVDQQFYFAIVHCGLKAQDIEPSMKKAGLFFPEKLTVISYRAYQDLHIGTKRFNSDVSESIIYWSLRVLKNWAEQHRVIVFIQTYPEISPSQLPYQWFKNLNHLIKRDTQENGFRQVDHNVSGIDWQQVATPFHVNTQGHTLMKNKLKEVLTDYFNTTSQGNSQDKHNPEKLFKFTTENTESK